NSPIGQHSGPVNEATNRSELTANFRDDPFNGLLVSNIDASITNFRSGILDPLDIAMDLPLGGDPTILFIDLFWGRLAVSMCQQCPLDLSLFRQFCQPIGLALRFRSASETELDWGACLCLDVVTIWW